MVLAGCSTTTAWLKAGLRWSPSGLMCRTGMISSDHSDTSYSGVMRASATGRRLVDPKGGSFWFDAGAVCLDFAHTGGEGQYAKFETLHRPDALAEWLAEPPLGVVLTGPVTARDLAAA